MPVPIPPWLSNVGDPVANYARGLQLGQQAAGQQFDQLQRMQELNARREEAARRINAEVEMQRQRLTQQRQLEERALALKEAEQQIPAEQAALQFRGQKMYEDTLGRLTATGVSEEEARRQALLTAAPFLFSRAPAAVPATIRALTAPGKPEMMEFGGRMPPAVIDPRGVPHWPAASATAEGINPTTAEVTHPVTGEPMGTFVRTGPRSGSFVAEKESPETRATRTRLMTRIKGYESRLATAEETLAVAKPGSKTYEAVSKTIQSLNDKIAADEAALKGLTKPARKLPAVGDIEDGFRYIGGPRGSRDSWEPVNEEEQ